MEEVNKENIRKMTKDSVSVVFHRFSFLSNDENKNKIFCFYEGKDASYYSLRIEKFFNDDYLNFSCKNKKNVIKIHEKVKHKKDDFILAFFVDSDFDKSIDNKDIYQTPTYSIENLYCYENTISKILKNEFFINDNEEKFKKIIELYNSEIQEYSKCILLFNAWYRSLKLKKEKEKLESTNVSLDDKLPSSFIQLKIGDIKSNYSLIQIRNKYKNAIDISNKEVLESLNYLKSRNLTESLRGKFLLHFLIQFCEFLVKDSKNNKEYIEQNINFNTNKTIVLSHFSNYATTPECLNNYLKKRCKKTA